MFRIDHPTAVAELPAVGAAGVPGYFSAGDPATSAQATVVTADWANAIQEEIANVIEGAGIALQKGTNNQLLTAINALVTGVGAGVLLKANNLSDVTDVGTARQNLGLGALAVKNTAAIADVAGLQAALDGKAALAGAAFSGAISLPAGVGLRWVRGATPLDIVIKESVATPVYGAADAVVIRNPNASSVEIHTNGIKRVTIDANGNATFTGTITAANFNKVP